MNFFALCPSIFVFALFEPVWCENIFIGSTSAVWDNNVIIVYEFDVYRNSETEEFEMYSYDEIDNDDNKSSPHLYQSFVLIDFSAQINNLVYLNVSNENDFMSIAFQNIAAVHNIYRILNPGETQTNEILVCTVALQHSSGELSKIADSAAFDMHPGEGFVRFILHSRYGDKLPIAIFESNEFNVRFIEKTLYVILAIRPQDGESEIFYYGLKFSSKTERNKLKDEVSQHVIHFKIPDELDKRFIAFFKGKTILKLEEKPLTIRGNYIKPDFIQ